VDTERVEAYFEDGPVLVKTMSTPASSVTLDDGIVLEERLLGDETGGKYRLSASTAVSTAADVAPAGVPLGAEPRLGREGRKRA
jgi:hypothetical protein